MRSIIISAGKYGEVYLSFLRESGIEVIGFLDDNPALHNQVFSGIPVLGPTSLIPELRDRFGVEAIYCPLGNNHLRVKFLTQAKDLGYKTPNFIHPSVLISPDVKIGEGVYILPGTIIMPFCDIHDYVMISVNVNITHHSTLKMGTFISSLCNFGASITAEEFSYCGMGSTIMTGVNRLGKDCLIGAGAVVIRDVPDGAIMAGVPAKVIKYKDSYNNQ